MSADDHLQHYDELYEGAPCGLLTIDQAGFIQQANKTFCDWIGRSKSELVGRIQLHDLLTSGGKILHQKHWMPLLQTHGSVSDISLEIVHSDRLKVPMLMNATRRERNGAVTHDVAVFISEDQRAYEREVVRSGKQAEAALVEQNRSQRALEVAEQRLRMAVEAAQLCSWEDNSESGVREFDDSAALFMGYITARGGSSEHLAQSLEPSDRPFPKVSNDDSPKLYRHEYRVNGVDGIQRTILETGRLLPATTGATRHVGVLQDISEITRQRASAEDRAQFAEQMIGIVSHDLRNPLSAIMLGCEMLFSMSLGDTPVRYTGLILQAAKRAQRMVADLLDFTAAKIGRGIAVRKTFIDLQALVSRGVEELSLVFPRRTLRHVHSGSLPCDADADRLLQLIGNLVANAFKYGAPDGEVVVSSESSPGEFSIAVHNKGLPIPQALITHIFEPMSRGVEGSDSTRSVGLGLFIVREIARGHGGRVFVESAAHAGTTFTVRIPRLAE